MEDYRLHSNRHTKRLRAVDYCPELPFDLSNPRDCNTDCYRRGRLRRSHSHRSQRYPYFNKRRMCSPTFRRRLLKKEMRLALEPESLY